jgi:hypothetical protein
MIITLKKTIVFSVSLSVVAFAYAEKKRVTYISNGTTAALAVMLERGDIKEDKNLQGAIFRIAGGSLEETMRGYGYSHRLKEHMESWSVIKDGDYVVILGTVRAVDSEGHFFVWVLHMDPKELRSDYLKIGASVMEGREYPRGVVPYHSLWSRVAALVGHLSEIAREWFDTIPKGP